jgi:hypothetical protein
LAQPCALARYNRWMGEVEFRGEVPRPGPRETLRHKVVENAEALSDAVIEGATGEGSVQRGRLALSAIERLDPPLTASVKIPKTIQEVQRMNLDELEAVARVMGIEP